MQRFILVLAIAVGAILFHPQTSAQAQSQSTAFELKTYVYEPWIKGKFSEVVTVKNPGKWIFLAGIGPESEGDGKILFPGDFYRQCKYAYYRIKKLLAMLPPGASVGVTAFAWPDMLLEIAATAAVEK
jgi:2-iminobutanoate/2-iminopropanoate deaminase